MRRVAAWASPRGIPRPAASMPQPSAIGCPFSLTATFFQIKQNRFNQKLTYHFRDVSTSLSTSPSSSSRSSSSSSRSSSIPVIHYLSSITNPIVRHCIDLQSSSNYRHLHRQFIIHDLFIIKEAIQRGARIQSIFFHHRSDGLDSDDKGNSAILLGKRWNDRQCQQHIWETLGWHSSTTPSSLQPPLLVYSISLPLLTKVAKVDTLSGGSELTVAAIVVFPSSYISSDHISPSLLVSVLTKPTVLASGPPALPPSPAVSSVLLICDNIQDPANIGAILRSAVAFNVSALIMIDCVDIFNAKSVRASRGTLFSLRYMLRVSTTKASSGDGDGKEKLAVLGKVLKEQGYLCVGGVGAANSSQGTSRTPLRRIEDPSVVSWILEHPNVALVVGNEGRGIHTCLFHYLNIYPLHISSADPILPCLNVNAATAILLFFLNNARLK